MSRGSDAKGTGDMELVGQSLLVYALGIVISLIVAVVIWGIDFLVARGSGVSVTARSSGSSALPAEGTDEVGTAGLTSENLAVIAAAVATVMSTPHRIIHIEDAARSRFWTAEGRMIHQTSHSPRRRSGR